MRRDTRSFFGNIFITLFTLPVLAELVKGSKKQKTKMNNINITPQEKAQELVNKHYSLITGMELSYVCKLVYLPIADSYYQIAIQCALISVDEILNEHNHFIQTEAHFLYWQEVKEALIKKQEQ